MGGESTLSSSSDARFASKHVSWWLGADAVLGCLLNVLVSTAAGMALRKVGLSFSIRLPAWLHAGVIVCSPMTLVWKAVDILAHCSTEWQRAALQRLLDLEPLGCLQLPSLQ